MSADLRSVAFAEMRGRIVGNRLAVYDALRASPQGRTGSELAAAMGWHVTSVRPRLTELRDLLHAVTTGVRRDGEHEFRALSPSEAMALYESQPFPTELPRPAPVATDFNAARAVATEKQSDLFAA